MKRFISILLGIILVVSTIGFSFAAEESKTIKDYNVGDIIEFGWYPQSKVDEESDLFTELNMCGGEWHSYEYYAGTGEHIDGQMEKSDEIMRYKDVVFAGKKYRGVRIINYRPQLTSDMLYSGNTYQEANGYFTYQEKDEEKAELYYSYSKPIENGKEIEYYKKDDPYTPVRVDTEYVETFVEEAADYWFEYEPVKWQVVNPDTGFVVAQTVLDSQSYNGYLKTNNGELDANNQIKYFGDADCTFYANNYENSEIRNWLNDDFMNYVFSTNQLNIINDTTVENSAYIPDEDKPFPDADSTLYDSADTTDKIYLLSYNDIINPDYTFSDLSAECTDYAKSQGIKFIDGSSYNGMVSWRLRTAGNDSENTWYVNESGKPFEFHGDTIDTSFGIRPAMNFKLNEEIKQSDVKDNEKIDFTGYEIIYDANGGEGAPSKNVKSEEIEKTLSGVKPERKGFEFVNWNTQPDGKGTSYESSGKYIEDKDVTLYALWSVEHNHLYEKEVVEPTCKEQGYSKYTCKCGDSYKDSFVDAKGHTYEAEIIPPTCLEKGYTIHKCSCGDEYKDSEVAALGHDFQNYVPDGNAGCEDGTKTATCERDGCDATDTIPDFGSGTGHTYELTYVKPDCLNGGYIIHTCHCGDTYTDNYVDAFGHDFRYVYNGDATIYEDGTETAVCRRCGLKGETRVKVGSKINPTGNTIINVTGEDRRIAYRSIITIKATAYNLPEDYHLMMSVNGKEYTGNNREVVCEYGQLREDVEYAVWVADADGNIRTNNDGEQLVQKGGKITVIDGILERLVAFFRGLFCLLPKITVKPY